MGAYDENWREIQSAFEHAMGDVKDHELVDNEFENKPVFKKIKRGGKPVYRIGAHFNYDPKKYGPVGPENRTSFIVGASDKEKVSDVYRDFLKHIKALDDYGYTTDKESIEEVKKNLKKEIRHQVKMEKMKKIGTTAAITAGVAGAAYGGKKLYDHYKKDKTYYLKRKIYSSFSKALPGIQEIENFPYIDKDNCTVVNDHNLQVDKNAIANIIELFKNPEKYIIPAIYDWERSFTQGRNLKESDYKDTYCRRIEVIKAKGIDFYVRPIPGTKLYKVYGPQFIWQVFAYLGGTSPETSVIDGLDGEFPNYY